MVRTGPSIFVLVGPLITGALCITGNVAVSVCLTSRLDQMGYGRRSPALKLSCGPAGC